MRRIKVLDILLLCLKIVIPVLVLIPLVFFSYRMIDGRIEDIANVGNESYHSGMGLYLFASHIILLGINAVLLLIGLIGLLISKKHNNSPSQKNNIISFRYLTLSPLVSQLVYIVLNIIVMQVG